MTNMQISYAVESVGHSEVLGQVVELLSHLSKKAYI